MPNPHAANPFCADILPCKNGSRLSCSLPVHLCLLLLSIFAKPELPVLAEEGISHDEARRIAANLKYQTGTVVLEDGIATIHVPAGFKFLNREQSQMVLTKLWNNPPDEKTRGLLLPAKESPISDTLLFAVQVSYSEEGYIRDDEAKDLNYDDLLREMQRDASEANMERRKQGYPEVELMGWAERPFYDFDKKKLHWAKRLRFGDSPMETLNYNIRILGRKGVLVLNVMGDSRMLPRIKKDATVILSSADFNDGFRYKDFNPDVDRIANYGIGALIAGKVLKSAGFLTMPGRYWKFGLLGLIPAFVLLQHLLRRKFG